LLKPLRLFASTYRAPDKRKNSTRIAYRRCATRARVLKYPHAFIGGLVSMKRSLKVTRFAKPIRLISVLLTTFLFCQPTFLLIGNAQGRKQRGERKSAMPDDQRIAHVLSRLTFGARPGDFERVKAMGIDVFITQQLDADSIDDTGAIATLKQLPTLGIATPVIIEQY